MPQASQESRARVSASTEQKVDDVITTHTELNRADLRGMGFDRRVSIAIRALESALSSARGANRPRTL